MKTTFPFDYINTNKFGKVFRPYATISVWKKDIGVYVSRMLVVDTGADFTIFPRKDAFLFGIDLVKETTRETMFGIGGTEEIFLYSNLKIKIGTTELFIPVGFLNRSDVPALLGRQHALESFSVTFEDHKTIIQRYTER